MAVKFHNPLGNNNMRLEQKIALKLTQQKKTLAIAESCTGGLLAHTLTNLPGASQFFYLGLIAYDNSAKTALLGIPPSIIKKHGAVSQSVAKAMAIKVRKILNTDYGLSITGIAGPSGGTADKPVGLVFIAVSSNKKILVKSFHFKGTRLSIKNQAVQAALKSLLSIVSS